MDLDGVHYTPLVYSSSLVGVVAVAGNEDEHSKEDGESKGVILQGRRVVYQLFSRRKEHL